MWTPHNAIELLLGKKPAQDLAASGQRSMLERIKSLKNLVVINDEAHHVHDENLQWSQSLLAIRRALPQELALWLDFSATPRDQNGMYFPWTVCDYPLAQAVEDRIVKAPLIVTKEDDPKQPEDDPVGVTKNNISREVRLLAARGDAALEGAQQGLQTPRYPAGALHHGREERLRRRDRQVSVEDQRIQIQGV